MYKVSWGQKRMCPCNKIKYYDLGRDTLECPECGKEIEVTNLIRPRRGRKPGSTNSTSPSITNTAITNKPKETVEDDLETENTTLENETVDVEDDAMLLEDDADVDPAIDTGIKPADGNEDI